jgi:hypothetical protein
LQVRPDERWESLRPHLDEIGVGLTGTDDLDQAEVVFQEMGGQVCGEPPRGLLGMPGIKPEQVGRFYEAAAHFFQQPRGSRSATRRRSGSNATSSKAAPGTAC